MPRRGASLTQADVARVLRAAKSAGINYGRIVVTADSVIFEPPGDEQEEAPRRPVAGKREIRL